MIKKNERIFRFVQFKRDAEATNNNKIILKWIFYTEPLMNGA